MYVCVCLQDLVSWVSGEHGFIVLTLGTMVPDMPEEITSIFLEAFRQIPQKVLHCIHIYEHTLFKLVSSEMLIYGQISIHVFEMFSIQISHSIDTAAGAV